MPLSAFLFLIYCSPIIVTSSSFKLQLLQAKYLSSGNVDTSNVLKLLLYAETQFMFVQLLKSRAAIWFVAQANTDILLSIDGRIKKHDESHIQNISFFTTAIF